MEFAFHTAGRAPDILAIEREIAALDPAALLDLDAGGQIIRIATSATGHELLACLQRAGVKANAEDVIQVPSQCCGGCGG